MYIFFTTPVTSFNTRSFLRPLCQVLLTVAFGAVVDIPAPFAPALSVPGNGLGGGVDGHVFRNFGGQSFFSSYQRVGSNLGHPGRVEPSRRLGGGGGGGLRFRQNQLLCKRVGRLQTVWQGQPSPTPVSAVLLVSTLVTFHPEVFSAHPFCTMVALNVSCACRCTGEIRVGEEPCTLPARGAEFSVTPCVCMPLIPKPATFPMVSVLLVA